MHRKEGSYSQLSVLRPMLETQRRIETAAPLVACLTRPAGCTDHNLGRMFCEERTTLVLGAIGWQNPVWLEAKLDTAAAARKGWQEQEKDAWPLFLLSGCVSLHHTQVSVQVSSSCVIF
ncbi:unnamed protein product [Ixodes persulcatus]